jgi:hypothetical protein
MFRGPHRRRLLARSAWARALIAALFCWLHACSLVVGTEALQEGCPADQKACAGRCVSRADPDFGCDADDCRPCVIAQATARCSDGGCVVASCQGEFADCNADGDAPDSDGCEIDTAHDPDHCGGCRSVACEVLNGAPDCAGGSCSIRRCNDGYRDCNFDVSDGCESAVASNAGCE